MAPTKREPSAMAKMSDIFFGEEDAGDSGVLDGSDLEGYDQDGFEKDHILEE